MHVAGHNGSPLAGREGAGRPFVAYRPIKFSFVEQVGDGAPGYGVPKIRVD